MEVCLATRLEGGGTHTLCILSHDRHLLSSSHMTLHIHMIIITSHVPLSLSYHIHHWPAHVYEMWCACTFMTYRATADSLRKSREAQRKATHNEGMTRLCFYHFIADINIMLKSATAWLIVSIFALLSKQHLIYHVYTYLNTYVCTLAVPHTHQYRIWPHTLKLNLLLNLVERRRRDRINELIKVLAQVVPGCQKKDATTGNVVGVSVTLCQSTKCNESAVLLKCWISKFIRQALDIMLLL